MMRNLERLARNIKLAIAQGVASGISEGGRLLQLSLLADESADEVERIQNYGFASHPPTGGSAAVVFIAGYREQGMAVAVEGPDGSPDDLESGEVKIYTASGDAIHFKSDGTLRVYSQREVKVESDDKIALKASDIEIDGDLKIKGDVETEGDFEIDGDLHTTGDIETDKDCIVEAQTKRHSQAKHGHATVLGPTVPPGIPTQGA